MQEQKLIQSLAGIVRENLPEIERKIFNGVRVASIHSDLVASTGAKGNLWSFRKALTRARIQKRMADAEKHPPLPGVSRASKDINSSVLQAPALRGSTVAEGLDKYFVRKSMFDKKD